MTAAPYDAKAYDLPTCRLEALQSEAHAREIGALLVSMDPWRTLGYSAESLSQGLLRQDSALHRFVVTSADAARVGVVCIRYPWLRGAYLELIALAPAAQGSGMGATILEWFESESRRASSNAWVLVSDFNVRARRFYQRQGYAEVGHIADFIQPGKAEVLLRKALT